VVVYFIAVILLAAGREEMLGSEPTLHRDNDEV
jgi:hypothetical protein